MLRIKVKGRESAFVYKCLKKEVPNMIAQHLRLWGREQSDAHDESTRRDIPVTEWVAEWQDGDAWNPNGPVEVIPIPGATPPPSPGG
jgi:hypothetical protein